MVSAIRYLQGRDGGAALKLIERYGKTVRGTREKGVRGCAKRHVGGIDKDISYGMHWWRIERFSCNSGLSSCRVRTC